MHVSGPFPGNPCPLPCRHRRGEWGDAGPDDDACACRLACARSLVGLERGKEDELSAKVALRLGHDEVLLDYLAVVPRERNPSWESAHADARYAPAYDHLRRNPRFEQLLRDNLPESAKPFLNPGE